MPWSGMYGFGSSTKGMRICPRAPKAYALANSALCSIQSHCGEMDGPEAYSAETANPSSALQLNCLSLNAEFKFAHLCDRYLDVLNKTIYTVRGPCRRRGLGRGSEARRRPIRHSCLTAAPAFRDWLQNESSSTSKTENFLWVTLRETFVARISRVRGDEKGVDNQWR